MFPRPRAKFTCTGKNRKGRNKPVVRGRLDLCGAHIYTKFILRASLFLQFFLCHSVQRQWSLSYWLFIITEVSCGEIKLPLETVTRLAVLQSSSVSVLNQVAFCLHLSLPSLSDSKWNPLCEMTLLAKRAFWHLAFWPVGPRFSPRNVWLAASSKFCVFKYTDILSITVKDEVSCFHGDTETEPSESNR